MSFIEIQEKVAIVTGSAQGIGEAVVRKLSELGATVAAVDKNSEKLKHLVNQLKSEGLNVIAFPADVSNSKAVEEVVTKIEYEVGPIEILLMLQVCCEWDLWKHSVTRIGKILLP